MTLALCHNPNYPLDLRLNEAHAVPNKDLIGQLAL